MEQPIFKNGPVNSLCFHPPKHDKKTTHGSWLTKERFAWNDARASLQQNARLAVAIVTAEPDAAFWSAARAVPWLDLSRAYLVSASATRNRGRSAMSVRTTNCNPIKAPADDPTMT